MSIKTDDLASSDEIKIYNGLEDEEEPEHDRALLQNEILREVLERFVSVRPIRLVLPVAGLHFLITPSIAPMLSIA